MKRQDFRVYERKEKGRGRLALCGEVKLPGSQQGRSPFGPALMEDAYNKATREDCQYFFTWNVEHLALFDRSRWNVPSMHERCVWECKLGMELNKPEDITLPAVRVKLEEEFLPRFFAGFADLWLGRKKDFGLPPSDFYVTVLESHLTGPRGPVRELRDYLDSESARKPGFRAHLWNWMAQEQQWTSSMPSGLERLTRLHLILRAGVERFSSAPSAPPPPRGRNCSSLIWQKRKSAPSV